MTDPITELVTVEVYTDDAWTDYLCDARSVTIRRGGTQDGVVTSLDVGTASVALVNAGDPVATGDIVPNTPVRITSGLRPRDFDLYNVDFDSGLYPSYMRPISGTFTVAVTTAPTGGHGDALHVSSATASTSTTLGFDEIENVVEGQPFRVSFRAYTSTAVHNFTQIRICDHTLSSAIDTSTTIATMGRTDTLPVGAWKTFTFTYVATQDIEKMGIYFDMPASGTNKWNLWLDDIVIETTRVEIQPLFTGTIQDVNLNYDRAGNEFVSFLASDGVRSLNNTQRYGAVTDGGAGFEGWAARMRRLAASATTETNPPDGDDQSRVFYTLPTTSAYEDVNSWTAYSKPTRVSYAGSTPRVMKMSKGWAVRHYANLSLGTAFTSAAGVWGMEHTLTGLVVGRTYAFTGTIYKEFDGPYDPASYYIGVQNIGWSSAASVPAAGDTATVTFEFEATSTTHKLRVSNAVAISVPAGATGTLLGAYYLVNARVVEFIPDAIVLQDIVYESTLANHFDLASNSVGAVWWADKRDVIQFRRALDKDESVANFSDIHITNKEPEAERTRINYVTNPRYRNSTSGWFFAGGSSATFGSTTADTIVEGYAGYRQAKAANPKVSGTTEFYNRISATGKAGETWTVQGLHRLSQAGISVGTRIEFQGASGTVGSGVTFNTSVANQWTRGKITATATGDFDWVYIRMGFTATLARDETFSVTQAQIEHVGADEEIPYFDGDTPSTDDTFYAWSGTSHASSSTELTFILPIPEWDPLHACYTNIEASYATANVINDLTLANHGRTSGGDANDVNYRREDTVSVALWGSRAASVETSIYNGGAFVGSIDVRAEEITDAWGTPEFTISSVTFDARDNIGILDNLDVFSRVTVTYRGTTHLCRVVGIDHDIETDKWITTLSLRKDQ